MNFVMVMSSFSAAVALLIAPLLFRDDHRSKAQNNPSNLSVMTPAPAPVGNMTTDISAAAHAPRYEFSCIAAIEPVPDLIAYFQSL